jgi:uncharacterized membrane protein/protein-disulfide isomerase
MARSTRWWLLGLALIGLAFAGTSAWVHYKLLTEPNYISPCDINATFNCTQVYLSPYGSVSGVPVALGGVFWFGLVALIAAFSQPSTDKQAPAASYVFALATIGLAAVLYLAYTSFFRLKTGCVLCIGTYASVVGIFVVSGLAASVSLMQLPARLFRDVRAAIAPPTTALAVMLFFAATGSLVAFFPREGAPEHADRPQAAAAAAPTGESDADKQFAAAWAQQPRVDMGIPAGQAKVLVVKFIDWQCPSCKAAHFTYKPIFEKYEKLAPGAVHQVVKDYPLSNRCNFNMTRELHQAACEEAAFVRMARDRNKYDEVVDWLFSVPDQQGLTITAVKAEAQKRLGVTDFDKEYEAKLFDIKRDVADGGALRVGSTPTYFINGVRAETPNGWLPGYYFELALRLELEKAGVTVR